MLDDLEDAERDYAEALEVARRERLPVGEGRWIVAGKHVELVWTDDPLRYTR